MESCRSCGFRALTGCQIQLDSIHIYTKRNLHNTAQYLMTVIPGFMVSSTCMNWLNLRCELLSANVFTLALVGGSSIGVDV